MKEKICLVCVAVVSSMVIGIAATAWTVVPSASRGTVESLLNSVAVVADNDVWAAGHWYDSRTARYRTFIERWNGSGWRIVSTPDVGGGYNDLNGVAASHDADAWAVGYWSDTTYGYSKTLILHWNGSSWSVVPSPNPGPGNNVLYGVTALSPGDAWAVGWYYDADFVGRPLVLRWNGSSWKQVAAPSTSTYFNALQSVAATGPADAWAGGHASVSGRYATFLMHWDGATWTVVPSPNVGAKHNRIRAVSAASPLDVWAVGDSQTGGSLIEHWNGSAWSVVEHPVPGGTHTFWGVSALAANDAWVSGYVNASTGLQPLIEHWDGAAWQQQTPAQATPRPWLTAISGLPGGDVWAVGGVGTSTLTMRTDR